MKLCRGVSLISAVLLCVSLSGCKELPMDYSNLTTASQTVIVGETLTLPVALPTEKAKGEITSVTDGIGAEYTAPSLTITGKAPGEQSVTIEFSAGWLYKKSSITIPVTSLLPQLTADVRCELLGISANADNPNPSIKLEMGTDAVFTADSPEADILLAAKSTLPEFLEVSTDGLNIKLHPVKPGKSSLDIELSKEGFRSLAMNCPVEVIAIPVPLALPKDGSSDIKVEKGKATTISLEHEGELSVSVDNAAVTASVEDGKVKLSGISEGTAKVTVTAKKENYLDSTLTLNCTVTAPAPPPAPAAPTGAYASLVSEIVKYTNIERANAGLAPLKLNNTLSSAAAIRAKETATEQSHTRPDGRRGLTAIQDAGLGTYDAEGENLSGSSDTEDGASIVARWMASPPHREAILFPQFKSIGVGVYYDGDMYRYCQLFTGTKLN